MTVIIDRRKNPTGKSIPNRNRFFKRAKELVKKAVKKNIDKDTIETDSSSVSIETQGIKQPSISHDYNTGINNRVLPGNVKWIVGDIIQKPPPELGNGSGGSMDGEGEDNFKFQLSPDEYKELFFEHLELPDECKKSLDQTTVFDFSRNGYTQSGSPANLDLRKSMKNSIGRRIAIKRPKPEEIAKLEQEIEERENQGLDVSELKDALAKLKKRTMMVPWIDPIDLRYVTFTKNPKPITKSVMFCLMDCSGSMNEQFKMLAKRFFKLLYMFLKTSKYEKVDIVFVRYTNIARVCNEEDFFYTTDSGGTVASTAFDEVVKLISEKYNPIDWNIYIAHASDGDNAMMDNDNLITNINKILGDIQYYCYIQTEESGEVDREYYSDQIYDLLIKTYGENNEKIGLGKVRKPTDIFPVFSQLFKKRT
jgi:uncharacterized sporulation protein YeaH/YhbH (DUF444 family)